MNKKWKQYSQILFFTVFASGTCLHALHSPQAYSMEYFQEHFIKLSMMSRYNKIFFHIWIILMLRYRHHLCNQKLIIIIITIIIVFQPFWVHEWWSTSCWNAWSKYLQAWFIWSEDFGRCGQIRYIQTQWYTSLWLA